MNKELKELLKKHNQEHLIKQYERLDDEKKKLFLADLETIDFDFIESLYNKNEETNDNDEITPIDYYDKEKLENAEYYEGIGNMTFKRWFFEYNKETDAYDSIDEPRELKHYAGFALG